MSDQIYMLTLAGEPHAVGTIEQLKAYCELDTFDEYNKHGSDERFSFWVEDWKDIDDIPTRKYSQLDDYGPFEYAEIYTIINAGIR